MINQKNIKEVKINLPTPVFKQKAFWLECRALDKMQQMLTEHYKANGNIEEMKPFIPGMIVINTDVTEFGVFINRERATELEELLGAHVYETRANVEFERSHPNDN